MLHSDIEFLKHINDECDFILKHTADLSFNAFVENDVLKKATERSLEIIGEASKKIEEKFKSNYPEIEWRQISATRNIIIHDYAGVDYSSYGISYKTIYLN